MTNPDNVGGLPNRWRETAQLAPPEVAYVLRDCADELEAELCRAAPAGGDYRGVIPQVLDETINGVVSDLEMIAAGKDQVTGDPVSGLQSQRIAKAAHDRLLSAWNACDSAPAGSGEVGPQLEMVEAYVRLYTQLTGHSVVVDLLNDYAALLRKLQQGADENSLRAVAKRNLRSLINIGSDDKALMLKCLEELS